MWFLPGLDLDEAQIKSTQTVLHEVQDKKSVLREGPWPQHRCRDRRHAGAVSWWNPALLKTFSLPLTSPTIKNSLAEPLRNLFATKWFPSSPISNNTSPACSPSC